MLKWFRGYALWTLLGVLLTIEAAKYEFERRGSLEFGGEYLILFLPLVVYFVKVIVKDSKKMRSECLSEGWTEY